jgi:hypothetical protein
MTFKILCLWDFSSESYLALSSCFSLASVYKEEGVTPVITLFHVAEKGKKIDAELRLREIQLEYGDKTIAADVPEGDLFDCFEAKVKRFQPDFVVFGTHGVRGISQYLFGAYAVRILKLSECPVMICSVKIYNGMSERLLKGKTVLHVDYTNGAYNSKNRFRFLHLANQYDEVYLHGIYSEDEEKDRIMENKVELDRKSLDNVKRVEKSIENLGHGYGIVTQITDRVVSEGADLLVSRYGFERGDDVIGMSELEGLVNNDAGVPVLFM